MIEENSLDNELEIGWSIEECSLGIPRRCEEYQSAVDDVMFAEWSTCAHALDSKETHISNENGVISFMRSGEVMCCTYAYQPVEIKTLEQLITDTPLLYVVGK